MSTPSRYCWSPKRTINGTMCTPSACASAGEMSAVLSVTRWINSLEREHVRVVLLASRLELELDCGIDAAESLDQSLGVLFTPLVTAVHGHQFRLLRLRLEHRVDDLEVFVADLRDHIVDHRDHIA